MVKSVHDDNESNQNNNNNSPELPSLLLMAPIEDLLNLELFGSTDEEASNIFENLVKTINPSSSATFIMLLPTLPKNQRNELS